MACHIDRRVFDGAVLTVARVVHEDVDASLLGDHTFDRGSHRSFVRDIERDWIPTAGLKVLHPIDSTRSGVHNIAV